MFYIGTLDQINAYNLLVNQTVGYLSDLASGQTLNWSVVIKHKDQELYAATVHPDVDSEDSLTQTSDLSGWFISGM